MTRIGITLLSLVGLFLTLASLPLVLLTTRGGNEMLINLTLRYAGLPSTVRIASTSTRWTGDTLDILSNNVRIRSYNHRLSVIAPQVHTIVHLGTLESPFEFSLTSSTSSFKPSETNPLDDLLYLLKQTLVWHLMRSLSIKNLTLFLGAQRSVHLNGFLIQKHQSVRGTMKAKVTKGKQTGTLRLEVNHHRINLHVRRVPFTLFFPSAPPSARLQGQGAITLNNAHTFKTVSWTLTTPFVATQGLLKQKEGQSLLGGAIDFQNLDLSQTSVFFSQPLLAGLYTNVQGRVSVKEWSPEHGLKTALFKAHMGQARINLPHIFPKTLHLTQGDLQGSLEENTVRFASLSFTTQGGTVLSWNGTLQKKKGWHLTAQGHMKHLSAGSLADEWPLGMAQDAREWVIANIPTGDVPEATLEMKAKLLQGQWHIENLKGGFQARHATVRFYDTFPPVHNINASATYDLHHMTFHVTSGHLLRLRLSGKIAINGIGSKPHIKITTQGKGPVSHLLKLLSYPPLSFKLAVMPKHISGDVKGNVVFSFPLRSSLTGHDILVSAQGTIVHTILGTALPSLPITGNTLSLNVTPHFFSVKGNVLFSGTQLALIWKEGLDHGTTTYTKVDVSGLMGLKSFRTAQINVSPYFSGGTSNVHIKASTHALSDHWSFHITADGTQTILSLDALNWHKPQGQPLHLSAKGQIFRNGMASLSAQAFSKEKTLLKGHVLYDSQKGLVKDALARIRLGHNDFTVSAQHRHAYTLNVSGEKIDLSSLMDHLISRAAPKKGTHTPKKVRTTLPPLTANIHVKNMIFKGHVPTKDVRLGAHYDGTTLTTLKSYLLFQDNHSASLRYTRNVSGCSLQLTTTALSDFLEDVFGGSPIKGGPGHLEGQCVGKKGPMKGRFSLGAYTLTTPSIGIKIFRILSYPGIFTLLSPSMPFFNMEGTYRYQEGQLHIPYIKTNNLSIGLRAEGSINFNTNTLNFKGLATSSYGFQFLLGHIPLLGVLLGGKEGALIGLNYTITGSLKNIQVQVNPFSLFTPGILRRLFFH